MSEATTNRNNLGALSAPKGLGVRSFANRHAPTFWSAPDLAKVGHAVFPVASEGKNPSVQGGFYAATTDLSEIAAWIAEGREHHNIAMPTGLPSGIVVVEADSPKAYAEMEAKHGPPTVKTERGGHWWHRHPRNGKVVSNNVKPGLDRKGDGGYVLVPPSLGRTWTNGIPRLGDLPLLPEEFWTKKAEVSDAPRSMPQDLKERVAAVVAEAVAGIEEGRRHEHLRHLCGVLLPRGVSSGDAEDVLVAAWTKVGGDLAKRASAEVPNTLKTTEQAIEEGRATGVPKLEEITPGLYEGLANVLGWVPTINPGKMEKAENEDRRNQGDRLIGYALEALGGGSLFVDQHGAPHALVDGSPLPLNSRCYSWLRRLMWEEEGRAVNGEYLKTAAGTLAAQAEFSGEERELYTRAAWHGDALYYELGPGRVIKVDSGGWTPEPDPPVLFRRFPNLKPLPDPRPGGSAKALASYVNLKTNRDRRLFVAYAATVPLPHIGRPILNASGAMGSGKTTAGRVIKRTWDPTVPETIRLDPREVLQKASHAFVLMLDNQNAILEWAADTLCRLVTGEADSKRRLYTDDEDVIIELRRAVLLNGINVPTDREDVLDRSLVVELERIPDGQRVTEEELWERFEAEHPRLLGALFDVLTQAMALKPSLDLSRRPRLADWGEWAAAVYEAMGWGAEVFLSDWDDVVRAQNQATLDGSPVAQTVLKFMEDKDEHAAGASQLHKELAMVAEDLGLDRDKAWPKSARWLWKRLNVVLPVLAAAGVEAKRERLDSGSVITLRKTSVANASHANNDGTRAAKGQTVGNKSDTNASPNARTAPNASANAGENPAQAGGSGSTGNTGISTGAPSVGPDGESHSQRATTAEEKRRVEELVGAGMSEKWARKEVLAAGHPLGCGCGVCA